MDSIRKYDDKIEAIKLLKALSEGKDVFAMRRSFCLWRDRVNTMDARERLLDHTLKRRHKLGLREAYLRWLRLTKRAQDREKYTALSEEVGATRMRQKVFLAWKEVLADSKNERVMGKYIAWRNWCDNIKF